MNALLPKSALLPLAAALALGAAGYAWQGSPGLAGQPHVVPQAAQTTGERIDKPLMGMVRNLSTAINWLMLSDSMARRGDTFGAAQTLGKATRTYPHSADLWVGYGAALLEHADGRETRASRMAFAKARALSAAHPGPDFYEGIGKVREGDLDAAERLWARTYERTDGDEDWRRDLGARLGLVRALIAERDRPAAGQANTDAPVQRDR